MNSLLVRPRQADAQPATKLISDLRAWASRLASENRDLLWVVKYYLPPRAFDEVWRQVENMSGGILGLVGLQGVGKSSALRALQINRILEQGPDILHSVDDSCPLAIDLGGR